MRRWWAGTGWTEAKEQAFQDRWALRILTCPRKACVRLRTCRATPKKPCPGLKTYPLSDAETFERVRLLRTVLKNKLYEVDQGIRPSEEERAAEAEHVRQMQALALKRAKKALGWKT